MALTADKLRQGAAGVSTGYDIDNSLRFNESGSPGLSKTPSSSGNRKTWIYSAWVKRTQIADTTVLLSTGKALSWNLHTSILFKSDDTLRVYTCDTAQNIIGDIQTLMKFRDPSAWYHIVVAADGTQSTASNRLKIYVNGEEVAVTTTTSWTSSDTYMHHTDTQGGTRSHEMRAVYDGNLVFSGYLSEWYLIDGYPTGVASGTWASTNIATIFGETGTYGEWKPIEYTGAYGTNGSYLKFTNSADLGEDSAGSNDWNVYNLASTDQMVDTPTNNFATINPLDKNSVLVLKEGNLELSPSSATWTSNWRGTQAHSKGKWYYEVCMPTATNYLDIGITDTTWGLTGESYASTKSWLYRTGGSTHNGSVANNSLSANSSGDIIQIAYDLDAGKIWWGVNNSWILSGNPSSGTNPVYSNLSGTVAAGGALYSGGGLNCIVNFGQDSSFAGNVTVGTETDDNGYGSFKYNVPDGFLSLCTKNLPDPAVIPSEHFNTITHSTANAASITVGFQPDFIWSKARNNTYNHGLWDSIRGVTKILHSNLTTETTSSSGYDLVSFDSNGFTTGNNQHNLICGGVPYVTWNWKANGAGVSNTSGSITSTVSANADAEL